MTKPQQAHQQKTFLLKERSITIHKNTGNKVDEISKIYEDAERYVRARYNVGIGKKFACTICDVIFIMLKVLKNGGKRDFMSTTSQIMLSNC